LIERYNRASPHVRSRLDWPEIALTADEQSNLLEDLQTRVVVPISKTGALTKKPVSHLTPVLKFRECVLRQITGQPKRVHLATIPALNH